MMLDSKVAVAAIGTLKKLPSYSDIEIGLLDKDVSFTFYVKSEINNHRNCSGISTLQKKVPAFQMKAKFQKKSCIIPSEPRIILSQLHLICNRNFIKKHETYSGQ